MTRAAAFWDTSALVPLCTYQAPFTPKTKQLLTGYSIAVWWATPLEISSALARLLRMGELTAQESLVAKKLATDLADLWTVIQPSASILTRAISLTGQYPLTAADALQLSAALEWCGDRPQGRAFLTTDLRLRDAAQACGFDVSPL